MIIGSHNSWSYLKGKKWWMNLFHFMAKCQDCDIRTQYEEYGVRCFDLRVKYDKNGKTIFSHGQYVYDYTIEQMSKDLQFLDSKKDCYVRVLHEARNSKEYTEENIELFRAFCNAMENALTDTKFWCGRNLVNWKVDYEFRENPSCEEKYSSVMAPRLIDDWYPRLYARGNNKKNIEAGTDKDILLIDFVNYR
jgi:hypothetical protein